MPSTNMTLTLGQVVYLREALRCALDVSGPSFRDQCGTHGQEVLKTIMTMINETHGIDEPVPEIKPAPPALKVNSEGSYLVWVVYSHHSDQDDTDMDFVTMWSSREGAIAAVEYDLKTDDITLPRTEDMSGGVTWNYPNGDYISLVVEQVQHYDPSKATV